jgi:hypothetical protein
VAEALLDGEAEAISRKLIEKALEDDTTALRLCLERILPPSDRPVAFDLPKIETAADALKASASVTIAREEDRHRQNLTDPHEAFAGNHSFR